MYSIDELNRDELNIVCQGIYDEDLYDKLMSICPNIYIYDNKLDCYLTSRFGRGELHNYYGQRAPNGREYIVINVWDIEGFDKLDRVIQFSNGVPLDWEGEV